MKNSITTLGTILIRFALTAATAGSILSLAWPAITFDFSF
jgi:hypothetical protein